MKACTHPIKVNFSRKLVQLEKVVHISLQEISVDMRQNNHLDFGHGESH